jgi:hypothetical protein
VEEKIHKEKQMLRDALNSESMEINKRVDKVNIDRMNDTADIQAKVRWSQGDQIGRIFARWVILNFKQLFENHRSSTHFWATVTSLAKRWVGLHFITKH